MDMTGEYRIPAPREKVWAALNDAETLKASLPGCESLEKVSETKFVATVVAKVGPVKAKFNGNVELSNLNPPESYTIAGEGKGGAAGFAKGGADVRLAEAGADETVLTYTARADVGGKLAQLGSRLIDGTAKKMADEFFDNFRQQLTPPAAKPAPEAELPREYAAPPEPAPAGGLADLAQNKFVWAAGAIILLMLLVLLFR
ncbi:MAG TPA: carbon monoxide dehydrogenase subunit G [Geminicoccaceae bacterium]|nr:carbon monoxide dehydrogenase subunit G [Geminicoccaceae bacterium]